MNLKRNLATAMIAVAAFASAQCSNVATPTSPGAAAPSTSVSAVTGDESLTPRGGDRVTSGRQTVGDTVNNTATLGQIRVCKAGNVNGTFTVTGAAFGGGTFTTLPNPTVSTGTCKVVAESPSGDLAGANITITETPSTNLQSITISRNNAGTILPSPAFSNGDTVVVNSFHGSTITFTNNFTPPPAQLAVVKTPNAGTFTSGGQATFTIVVSNPAAAGSASATSVTLSDALPGNGGLVWTTAITTQGTCVSPIVGNNLSCALNTIAPQGSVTVTVSTAATTPAAACQTQNNPAANAAAAGGLTATDAGSLSCTPPPPPVGREGCTPGYWKQDQHFDSWKVYSQGADFDATFGVNFFTPNLTLLQALENGGGGLDALGRHAVAALLNAAAGSGVGYPYTTAQVIAIVRGTGSYSALSVEARKNLLADANELGCPLN